MATDAAFDGGPPLVHVDPRTLIRAAEPSAVAGRNGGPGLAVCTSLGVLVTSEYRVNTLSVFALPRGDNHTRMRLLRTIGGSPLQPRTHFDFSSGWGISGALAFTGPAAARRLVVTDHGNDAVHVIDVFAHICVGESDSCHVGYVASPGTICGPRGVAARGSLVAVSTWDFLSSSKHIISLFEGSNYAWTMVRRVLGDFQQPEPASLGTLGNVYRGLRFTRDGTGLAITNGLLGCISMYLVQDGAFDRNVGKGLINPIDLEECEGGWLVVSSAISFFIFVGNDDGGAPHCIGPENWATIGVDFPSALALVPGLGLAVRSEARGGVFIFRTPDMVAMAAMSANRVAWMVGVHRGRLLRAKKAVAKAEAAAAEATRVSMGWKQRGWWVYTGDSTFPSECDTGSDSNSNNCDPASMGRKRRR